jgi:hypothetical protein
MYDDIVGSWTLVAWQRQAANGAISYPLGQQASGSLIYAADGRMAVQMVAADRPLLGTNDALNGGTESQRASAYSSCLAYFGTFEVQDDHVVHHVEASLFPDWSGQHQIRPYTLDGDTLTLHTPPQHLPAGDVTNALIWRRLDQPEASGSKGSDADE